MGISVAEIKVRLLDSGVVKSAETIDRWINERNNIRQINPREAVIAAMGLASVPRTDEFKTDIDYLAGWLLLTIGVQSMPQSERSKLKNYSPFLGVRQRAGKSAEAQEFVAQVLSLIHI